MYVIVTTYSRVYTKSRQQQQQPVVVISQRFTIIEYRMMPSLEKVKLTFVPFSAHFINILFCYLPLRKFIFCPHAKKHRRHTIAHRLHRQSQSWIFQQQQIRNRKAVCPHAVYATQRADIHPPAEAPPTATRWGSISNVRAFSLIHFTASLASSKASCHEEPYR